MTQNFTYIQTIDSDFNEQARSALKKSGDAGGLSSVIYRDSKKVCLFDISGKYIYDFDLINGTITYRAGKSYAMDDKTKKMVKRFMIKDMIPLIVIGASAVIVFSLFVVGGIGANKTQKQPQPKQSVDTTINKDSKSVFVVDTIQQKSR